MSNLGLMVSRIASEIRRTGMNDEIKYAVAAAVEFWRKKRTNFNQLNFTFSTAIAQEYYTSADSTNIPLIAKIDIAMYVDGTYERALDLVDSNWIDDQGLVSASFRSEPEYLAYIRSSVRLFPVPNVAKTIRIEGLLELIDSSGATGLQRLTRDNVLNLPDSYASAWFTEGFEIIKSYAKGYLNLHVIKNTNEASMMYSDARDMADNKGDQAQTEGSNDMVQPSW